jgi:hypothetical protein
MVEVVSTEIRRTKTVTVDIRGAEPTKHWLSRPIIPDRLVIEFENSGDGWKPLRVEAHGGFVKADGTTGKTRTHTLWFLQDAPEYVLRLVEQYHPDREAQQ